MMGLGSHLNHKPVELSGGQQQRVAIARAIITKSRIVFADEPTGNLDTRTSKEVMELIMDMAETYKQTLVMVTHDPQTAAFADRVFHITDGKLEKIVNQKGVTK